MKKLAFLFLIAIFMVISSCAPRVVTRLKKTYPVLKYNEKVIVYTLEQEAPVDAEVIGQVNVGDSGFSTDCSYDVVLNLAKLEARKAGGNAIKITSHKTPNFWSTCHQITATILKIKTTENN